MDGVGMRRTMGVAAASAAVVLVAGCGGGGPQSSGDGKLTGDKIVLGVLNDQSGCTRSCPERTP